MALSERTPKRLVDPHLWRKPCSYQDLEHGRVGRCLLAAFCVRKEEEGETQKGHSDGFLEYESCQDVKNTQNTSNLVFFGRLNGKVKKLNTWAKNQASYLKAAFLMLDRSISRIYVAENHMQLDKCASQCRTGWPWPMKEGYTCSGSAQSLIWIRFIRIRPCLSVTQFPGSVNSKPS